MIRVSWELEEIFDAWMFKKDIAEKYHAHYRNWWSMVAHHNSCEIRGLALPTPSLTRTALSRPPKPGTSERKKKNGGKTTFENRSYSSPQLRSSNVRMAEASN